MDAGWCKMWMWMLEIPRLAGCRRVKTCWLTFAKWAMYICVIVAMYDCRQVSVSIPLAALEPYLAIASMWTRVGVYGNLTRPLGQTSAACR